MRAVGKNKNNSFDSYNLSQTLYMNILKGREDYEVIVAADSKQFLLCLIPKKL